MEPLPYQSIAALRAARAMRRYWRMIVGFVLVCGVGGYVYAAGSAGAYSASATILVRALVGNAYSAETSTTQAATVALETEAQLVASSQVTDLVRRGLPGVTCNPAAVTAKVLTNTQLIRISAYASTADTARQCAQAYATDYLARRQELAVATRNGQLTVLNAQLVATEKALASATVIANGAHPPPGATARVEAYSALLASIQTQAGQLAALSTQPGNVVVSASASPTASGLSPVVLALAGAVSGLLLGLLVAIARERRRHRLLTEAEVNLPDLPMLAAMAAPEPPTGTGGTAGTGGHLKLPEPADDEEFRQAAVKLLAHAVPTSLIAVTSLSVADTTAVPTVRLARALAATGYRVAVVDAVTDNPQVAALLDVSARLGLSEVLTTPDDRPPPHVAVTLADLTVITAGAAPASSGPFFPGPRMIELLEQLKEDHDFVLIATGAMNTADGMGPLLPAEAAVLVVHDRATRYADIEEAHAMTERLNAHLLGLIVLRGPVRTAELSSVPTPVPTMVWPGTLPQAPPPRPAVPPPRRPALLDRDLDPAGRTTHGRRRS